MTLPTAAKPHAAPELSAATKRAAAQAREAREVEVDADLSADKLGLEQRQLLARLRAGDASARPRLAAVEKRLDELAGQAERAERDRQLARNTTIAGAQMTAAAIQSSTQGVSRGRCVTTARAL